MSTVRVEREDGLATITLARAEKRNALDEAMLMEVGNVLFDVATDQSVRVIVFRADGPAFTVGGDLEMFAEVGGESHDLLQRIGSSINRGIRALHESPAIS